MQGFIDGLGAVDSHLRPVRKPSGDFTVPFKGSHAARLVTIAPRLKELGAVVSKLVLAVSAGPGGDAV